MARRGSRKADELQTLGKAAQEEGRGEERIGGSSIRERMGRARQGEAGRQEGRQGKTGGRHESRGQNLLLAKMQYILNRQGRGGAGEIRMCPPREREKESLLIYILP